MNGERNWKHRQPGTLVIARAGASIWIVAFSRRAIPGAIFRSREAAIQYALALACAAGLRTETIRVLAAA